MEDDFLKLFFLIIGNACKWIYYGGKKSIDEVSKENNLRLGVIVSVVFGFIIYFGFYSSL
jgi:hypothetical protein